MIISGVYVYPVKSCGGIRVKRTRMANYGLEHDRRFAVIDDDTDKVITLREEPRMALINTGINGNTLFLHAEGMPTAEVSLYQLNGSHREVDIHTDSKVPAMDQGNEIAEWWSSFLGRRCRLVATTEPHMRRRDVLHTNMTISWHDSSSLHVLTEESLADLGQRIAGEGHRPVELAIERFRPNIVIRGASAPYEEDGWHNLDIQNGDPKKRVILWARIKTSRGIVVNSGIGIREVSLVDSREPLRTLSDYRQDFDCGKKKVYFGMYFFPFHGGTVGEGDSVIAEGDLKPV